MSFVPPVVGPPTQVTSPYTTAQAMDIVANSKDPMMASLLPCNCPTCQAARAQALGLPAGSNAILTPQGVAAQLPGSQNFSLIAPLDNTPPASQPGIQQQPALDLNNAIFGGASPQQSFLS